LKSTRKYDVGVVVGRFQVPEFHAGHRHLLETVYENHKSMLVFLGAAPTHGTIENPLDFSIRQQMILDLYPRATVLMIMDRPEDRTWSDDLDAMIERTFPNRSILLYGGRDSFLKHYRGKHKKKRINNLQEFSGTELRANVDAKDANVDFRRGVIYALRYLYPRVFPTVDVAVLRTTVSKPNWLEVLMGRKKTLAGLIFPGGFVSPSDESFEVAAVRELREETGLVLMHGVQSLYHVTTMRIDDWRYRASRDKIITTFYQTDFFSGVPRAADDLDGVEWVPLAGSTLQLIASHHRPLFAKLLEERGIE